MKSIIGSISYFIDQTASNIATMVFGPATFILFVLTWILALISVLGILAWEWNLIGKKTFAISERIQLEEHIFQRMTEISFKPDTQKQSVLMEILSPSHNFISNPNVPQKIEKFDFQYFTSLLPFFKPDEPDIGRILLRKFDNRPKKEGQNLNLTKEESELIEKLNFQNELNVSVSSFLPQENKMMIYLKDCIVSAHDNWMCNERVPYLNGQSTYFGLFDGKWVTDYKGKTDGYSDYEIINWKTRWWIEKKRCGDFCYIDSVGNMEKKAKEMQQLLKKYLKSE